MNKKKGIIALQNQKKKLKDDSYHKDEAWVFQTASFVETLFGSDSVEFDFISKFSFGAYFSSGTSNGDRLNHFAHLKLKVERFLDNCIETLEIKGVYKPESKYKKWLTDPENWWKILSFIVSTLVAVAGIIYAAK